MKDCWFIDPKQNKFEKKLYEVLEPVNFFKLCFLFHAISVFLILGLSISERLVSFVNVLEFLSIICLLLGCIGYAILIIINLIIYCFKRNKFLYSLLVNFKVWKIKTFAKMRGKSLETAIKEYKQKRGMQ
jgi:hypothetical protein